MGKKYFGTDGIRGHVGAHLMHPELVLKLGWAVGKALASNNGQHSQVLIGKDTRISGYMFESALQAGIISAGVDVGLLGPMPTPGIAYLTRTFRAEAGIVISASHNPYHDNGIKFFSRKGVKISDELESDIAKYLEQPMVIVDSAKLGKAYRLNDATGRYIEFCKSKFPRAYSLKRLKIVLDCANGATYHVAPAVFSELRANVITIHDEPNGLNINDEAGSTKPELLRQRVLAENADVGIAFDGDGDRVVMVDHKGEVVDGDELLFIIAHYYQQHARLQGGVVGTVMSNLGLELAFKQLNIDFVRAAVGDRHVHQELKAQNWRLGGEASGHIVCLDLTTTGDGICSALQVLAAMRAKEQTLHELKQGMTKFPSQLINVKVNKHFDPHSETMIVKAINEAEQHFGNKGRVLLRASGTEPLIRVYVEGEDDKQVKAIAEQLASVVQQVAERV